MPQILIHLLLKAQILIELLLKMFKFLSVIRLCFEGSNLQFVRGYKAQMLIGLFLKDSDSNIACG